MDAERLKEIRALAEADYAGLKGEMQNAIRDLLDSATQSAVHVVVADYEYEGYGEPEAVFSNHDEAQKFVDKKTQGGFAKREVYSLLVDEFLPAPPTKETGT